MCRDGCRVRRLDLLDFSCLSFFLWLVFNRRRGRASTNASQADIRGCPIGARTPHEGSSVRTQSPLFRGSAPLQRSSLCRLAFRWCVSFPIAWHRNPDPASCQTTLHDQPHTVTISEIYFGICSRIAPIVTCDSPPSLCQVQQEYRVRTLGRLQRPLYQGPVDR